MSSKARCTSLYWSLAFLLLLSWGVQSTTSQSALLRGVQRSRKWRDDERPRKLKSPSELIAEFRGAKQFLEQHFKKSGHKLHFYKPNKPRRGIVICAGGRRLLVNALVNVKVLREFFRSQLPIELYYYGESEADPIIMPALEDLGVRVIDGSILPRPAVAEWPEKLHDYAKKVFSLYSTGFREVLLLDCDNQLLRSPESLFELSDYKKHGALFWPDYWTAGASLEAPKEAIYLYLDLPLPWKDQPRWASTESGQLLFNREVHAVPLAWVMWLNLWSQIVYEHVLGDKDTFEIAFMLSGKHEEFKRTLLPPRAAFSGAQEGRLKHVGMVQSIHGQPSFLHRTSGGKFDDKFPVEQQPVPIYITEPMGVARARRYVWHTEWAINVLDVNSVIFRPDCEDLHRQTISALCRVSSNTSEWDTGNGRDLAERYCQCGQSHSGVHSTNVPMLPVTVYGKTLVSSINFAFSAFSQVLALLDGAQNR